MGADVRLVSDSTTTSLPASSSSSFIFITITHAVLRPIPCSIQTLPKVINSNQSEHNLVLKKNGHAQPRAHALRMNQ